MNKSLETERLILRHFTEADMDALHVLLCDEEVNTFLPWYPMKNLAETRRFYEKNLAPAGAYRYAICRKTDNAAIGYVTVNPAHESNDFGYALRKEFWHQGITTEACRAVIAQLKQDSVPYITATHDVNNPRSGAVMQRLGMRYCYAYREQWQPKNIWVVFRMYQLNLDGRDERVYTKYKEIHEAVTPEESRSRTLAQAERRTEKKSSSNL